MEEYSHFVIRPVEANIKKCDSLAVNYNLYVLITVGDKEFRTHIDRNGGLNPHWSDKFDLNGYSNSVATIRVYDSGTMIVDNLVGEAIFSLSCMKFGPQRMQHKIELNKGTDNVGNIAIEFQPVCDTFERQPMGGEFTSSEMEVKTLEDQSARLPSESGLSFEKLVSEKSPKLDFSNKQSIDHPIEPSLNTTKFMSLDSAEESDEEQTPKKIDEAKSTLEAPVPTLDKKTSLMDKVKQEVMSFEHEVVHEFSVVGESVKQGVNQLGKTLSSVFHLGGKNTQSGDSEQNKKEQSSTKSQEILDKGLVSNTFNKTEESNIKEKEQNFEIKNSEDLNGGERITEKSSDVFRGVDFRAFPREISHEMGSLIKHAILKEANTNEDRIEPTPPAAYMKYVKAANKNFLPTIKDLETFGVQDKATPKDSLNLKSFDDVNFVLSKEGVLPSDFRSKLTNSHVYEFE